MKTVVPEDVINVVIQYHNVNKVLSCGDSDYMSHGHHDTQIVHKWTEIEQLKDKDIIQIRVGMYHTFFMDFQGIVWSVGQNLGFELCLGHNRSPITKITVFNVDDIRIKDIQCGANFVLFLDCNGSVWTCGDNQYKQCGDADQNGETLNVEKPTKMKTSLNKNVVEIKCGKYHGYMRTEDDKRYLWGDNQYRQILKINNIEHLVSIPHLIDTQDRLKIYDVFLGNDNTKIICEGD